MSTRSPGRRERLYTWLAAKLIVRAAVLAHVRGDRHEFDHLRAALAEDPDGSHYGWITTGRDEPIMVQPTRHQFAVQFRYNWQAEQDAGYGRMVRLRVEEVDR